MLFPNRPAGRNCLFLGRELGIRQACLAEYFPGANNPVFGRGTYKESIPCFKGSLSAWAFARKASIARQDTLLFLLCRRL